MTRLAVLLLSLSQSAIGVVGPLPAPDAPPGLQLELRTVGNKTTFRLSELVPLVAAFRSDRSSTYSIEIADGWNEAPVADRFLVHPSENVVDRRTWLRGIACCDSRRAFLTSRPAEYNHELTDFLRFTQPGEYRIQYTTRRIFTGRIERAYKPSTILVRSNIVTITITEDDRRLVDEMLPAALAGTEKPPTIAELRELTKLPAPGSLQPLALSDAMAQYRTASRQLRLLDTPAAIRARVAAIRMPSVNDWRRFEAAGNGYDGVDNSVAYSSRPDLVAEALRERAAAPDVGITRGYVELWATVLMERDQPALFRLRTDQLTLVQRGYAEVSKAAREGLLETLRDINRLKTGQAAEITAATIRQVEREIAKQ